MYHVIMEVALGELPRHVSICTAQCQGDGGSREGYGGEEVRGT